MEFELLTIYEAERFAVKYDIPLEVYYYIGSKNKSDVYNASRFRTVNAHVH